MSMNALTLQQAKDLDLQIPASYQLTRLSTKTLNDENSVGWYTLAKDRNNQYWLCYTAGARSNKRVEIDNALFAEKEKQEAPIGERLVEGSVIHWLVEKYESNEAKESEMKTSDAQKVFIDWAWAAHDMGASDVHFVDGDDTTSVVFRIHGLPYDYQLKSTKQVRTIIEAGMQLSPNRRGNPDRHKIEDLRIELVRGDKTITLRLNKTGASPGTHAVYRIIAPSKAKTFDELRLPKQVSSQLLAASRKPKGVIIITAPTNMGKSETSSAIYDSLDNERMIQLISDPIERQFPNKTHRLVQKEVNQSDDNRTYTSLLNAALRQDPDVVGIAEMRDADTAQRVYDAGLRSQLMITTHHAADPFSALTRMINDGVSPLVLADATRCIASQRLLPELCPDCRIPTEMAGIFFRNKKGCSSCVLGAVGRRVTAEALQFDDEHRDYILKSDIKGLEKHAKTQGYVSMQEDVKQLAQGGSVCPIDAETIVGDVFTHDEYSQMNNKGSAA